MKYALIAILWQLQPMQEERQQVVAVYDSEFDCRVAQAVQSQTVVGAILICVEHKEETDAE